MKLKFTSVWSLFQYPALLTLLILPLQYVVTSPPFLQLETHGSLLLKIKIWTLVLVLSNDLTPLCSPKRCSFHLGNLWIWCRGSFADIALKRTQPWKGQILKTCISCCLWLLCSWFGVAVFSLKFHPTSNVFGSICKINEHHKQWGCTSQVTNTCV